MKIGKTVKDVEIESIIQDYRGFEDVNIVLKITNNATKIIIPIR